MLTIVNTLSNTSVYVVSGRERPLRAGRSQRSEHGGVFVGEDGAQVQENASFFDARDDGGRCRAQAGSEFAGAKVCAGHGEQTRGQRGRGRGASAGDGFALNDLGAQLLRSGEL